MPLPFRALLPVLLDLVCVLAFAFGGKSEHEVDESDWVVLAIGWPFALAAVVAHVLLLVRGRETRRVWPDGVAIVAVTYVLGMVLRDVSGRGISGGFPVVAAIFLLVTMLGWRALATVVTARRGASGR